MKVGDTCKVRHNVWKGSTYPGLIKSHDPEGIKPTVVQVDINGFVKDLEVDDRGRAASGLFFIENFRLGGGFCDAC